MMDLTQVLFRNIMTEMMDMDPPRPPHIPPPLQVMRLQPHNIRPLMILMEPQATVGVGVMVLMTF